MTRLEQGIHLDVDFEETLADTSIDPIDLTSIIGNIVDNAMDTHIYFKRDVTNKIVSIYTYTDREDNTFNISISNNGIPIPEGDLKKIFMESYSTKAEVTKKERGFGLYIVDQIVKKYRGKILVKSDEVETEFLVKLPIRDKFTANSTAEELNIKAL